jgi:hypothetical protein
MLTEAAVIPAHSRIDRDFTPNGVIGKNRGVVYLTDSRG